MNAVVRRLVGLVGDEGSGYFEDLVGASKALGWRQITQPQPLDYNTSLAELADEVATQVSRSRGALADQKILDELAAAAALVASNDPPVGPILLQSIQELGTGSSVVVAASRRAAEGMKPWLRNYEVQVLTVGELERNYSHRTQVYVVGPPRFFRPSLVTAPVTSELSFVMPAWFGNRSVPRSAISEYAEGESAIRVAGRVITVGDVSEPVPETDDAEDDDGSYLPQPMWGARRSEDDRQPTNDEVRAQKVLLSGELAMWLDDGERIRSLDPRQPPGERVIYTDVRAVQQGTYLLLRQGITERGAYYQAAMSKIGSQAEAVDATQAAWKQALAQRLRHDGYRRVTTDLRIAGINTASRAKAWTDPSLIRPSSDDDFKRLLQWLGIPTQPTFGFATMLRKTLYQVSSQIAKQLEDVAAVADLSDLEMSGHLSLDIDTEGFRGITATRVLAISPFTEIVPRREARVPFIDRGGQWLE
ncbi:MAG: hypothetical protein DI630_18730 [Gordonia sp. (in: high G+C Gram-positive bacteria)]|nr:MAG: hypothetical protein DI630_18730 [Gordonia sp. (in: high G+C Gram-positive bacteria)]